MWDLAAFMETVARNGLDYIAVAGGENLLKYNGDQLYVRAKGTVALATLVTAAIANVDEWRFHRALDPNWNHSLTHLRDQTGAIDSHNLAFINYPFNDGDVLLAQADNANNAQYEALLLAITDGKDPSLHLDPNGLPVGARWVMGTGTTTLVAGTWTQCAITWSETFNITKSYKVLGLYGFSATGYALRMVYKGSSPWKGWGPGVPAGDTAILVRPLYGEFGEFKGDQAPDVQFLASAGDTAEKVGMLIVEV